VSPKIFQYAAASAAVTALLGANPVRFFPFGEADEGVAKPYAVWQLVYGSPENLLNEVPKEDTYGIQIDAYALTGTQASAVAKALRAALEPYGYVTAYNGDFREADTRLFRSSFTVEFLQPRT
jgi:hypothetical protein